MASSTKNRRRLKEPENLSALRKGLAQALTVSKAELDARLRAEREQRKRKANGAR